MGWIDSVFDVIDVVGAALALITAPMLIGALAVRVRRSRRAGEPIATAPAMHRMAALAVIGTIGVVTGLVTGVPLGTAGGLAVVTILVAALFSHDTRFWHGWTILFVIYTAVGLIVLIGLTNNLIDAESGGRWYGGRELILAGGPNANPTRPGWQLAILSLAILRYGLPLSVAAASAWQVASNGRLGAIERVALSLASALAVTSVIGSSAMLLLVFALGIPLGLHPVLAILGALGSLLILLVIGPGALDAFALGLRGAIALPSSISRGLGGAEGGLDALAAGQAALATAGADDRAVGASLYGWARGNVGWSGRMWLKFVKLLTVVIVLGLLGVGLTRAEQPLHVAFEPVSRELPIGFRVERALRAPGGDVWLVGRDGDLARFDPGDETVHHLDVGTVALTEGRAGGELIGLTSDTPPNIVAIDDNGVEEIGTLDQDLHDHVAVIGDELFAASDDGRLGRWEIGGGPAIALATGAPIGRIVATDSGLWVMELTDFDGGELQPVRRQLTTLEIDIDATVAEGRYTDIALPRTGTGWATDQIIVSTFDPSTGDRILDTATGVWPTSNDRSRLVIGTAGTVWVATSFGRVTELGAGDDAARYDFHYDIVEGLIEAETADWIVAADETSSMTELLPPDESVLAKWDH